MNRKFIQITPDELLSLLRGEACSKAADLPITAALASIQYVPEADQILLICKDDSFEPIAEGDKFPEIELAFC